MARAHGRTKMQRLLTVHFYVDWFLKSRNSHGGPSVGERVKGSCL